MGNRSNREVRNSGLDPARCRTRLSRAVTIETLAGETNGHLAVEAAIEALQLPGGYTLSPVPVTFLQHSLGKPAMPAVMAFQFIK
jgi:hypothetical protein